MEDGELGQLRHIRRDKWGGQHEQSTCTVSTRRNKGIVKIGGRPNLYNLQRHLERFRCARKRVFLHCRSGWIPKDGDAGELWDRLLQQLQPFGAELRESQKHSGNVSARMGEAFGGTV